MKDIGIFIEGWIAELIAPTYDAELEKAHGYALYLLLIPAYSGRGSTSSHSSSGTANSRFTRRIGIRAQR